MKTFQCTKCGCTVAQPTEPYRCQQCGSQGIGLFRALGESGNAYGMAPQQGFQSQPGYQQGGFQGGNYSQPNTYQQGGMNSGYQQGGFQNQGMNQNFQRPAQPGNYGGGMPGRPFGGGMAGGGMAGGGMPGGAMPGNAMNRMGGGMAGGFRTQPGGFQQQNPQMGNQMGGNFQRPAFGNPQAGNAFNRQPGFGQAGMNQPGMNQPGMNQPGMNQQMNQPQGGFGQAGMNQTQPGFGQSGMNQMGGFSQPGMNQPQGGFSQPGMNQQMNPQMNQPQTGFAQQSGMNQVGMNPQMGQQMNPQMGQPQGYAAQTGLNPQMGQQDPMAGQMAQQAAPQSQPQAAPQQEVPQAAPQPAAPQAAAPQAAAPQAAAPAPQPAAPQAAAPQAAAPAPQPAAPQTPAPQAAASAPSAAVPPSAKPTAPAQRPPLKAAPGQAPARPAGAAPSNAKLPPRQPGASAQNLPPRPTAAPQKRPVAQVQPRPAQRPPAPKEAAPAPAPEQKGIRVRQVPKRPAPNAPQERPRYRAPEPRPQIRPEIDRPERCYWGFPEQPPFTCDARPMRNAPVVDEKGRVVMVSQGKLFCLDITHPEPEVVWEYMIQAHVPGPIVVDQHGDYHFHAMDGYLHLVTKDGKQSYRPVQVGEPLGYAAPVVDGWGNTLISSYDGGLIRVNSQGQKDSKPYFRSRAKLDSAGVIAGGILYIGSEDGYLFAIDLDDLGGRSIWDQSKEVGYAGGFLNSSPAIGPDGIIVVATRAEKLMGFHSTGEVAWTAYMPGQLLGSPVIDAEGNIYVGASMSTRQGCRGYLVCVDGVSHKIRWQFETDDMIESTPCIGDDGTIYFGNNSGWLYALNAYGDKKWSAKFEAGIRSAGTIVAPKLLTFALDDDVLVGVRCESNELCDSGWPKIGHDNFHSFLGQTAPPKPVSEDAPE